MKHPKTKFERHLCKRYKNIKLKRLLFQDNSYWPFRGWFVEDNKGNLYFKEHSNPAPKRSFKRESSKRVRRYSGRLSNGNKYRKVGNNIYDLL